MGQLPQSTGTIIEPVGVFPVSLSMIGPCLDMLESAAARSNGSNIT